MKKVLSLLLAAVMIVSMFAGLQITSHALASSGSCGDNVTWTFNSSTGLLTISGNGAITIYAFYRETNIKKVVIKSGVTRIGSDAFSGCSGLTSVTIPNSVTSIGGDAFYDCSGLTSVTIPNSVTSIGYNAFDNCSGLTSVTIPNSVTSIESAAFADCSGLTSVIIPDSVTSIGDSAFFRCRSLTSVTIGNSVTSIGSYAFEYCNGLTSVTIPNSVTSIGDNAFYECERLKNVYYSGNEAKWNSISIGKGNTCLTNASREYAIISSCGDNAKSVLIPSTGELIINGSGAMTDYSSSVSPYNNQTGIKTVVINNGVTSIGGSAFSGCSGLTSVTIPDSITSIGKDVFKDCVNLNRVDITSMKAWCNIAFSNSTGNPLYYAHNLYLNGKLVENLIIPDSVTTIKFGAFFNCTSLKNVTIPGSVVDIKKSAFNGCSGLTSVKIPNSVTSIGEYAFRGCSGLTNVIIRNSVTSIGNYAFYECEQLKNVYYSGNEAEWNSISIGKGNTSLTNASREYVIISFCGSGNDVNYLLIPSTGELIISGSGEMANYSLGNSPFYNKAEIKTVVIEDGVTSIGQYAFYACSGLTSITIPASVTSIHDEAFGGCGGLTKVNISSIESWCKISFEISRTYPYSNPLYCAHNLYLNGEKVTDLVIPNSVTSIGKYAFYGCTSLTSITIPDTVTSIGNSTFSGCSGLTSIDIPNTVTSIGSSTFCGCSGLKSFTIRNSITSIGSYAFSGCKGLTSITIPTSVTSMGEGVFNGCSGLTSIAIPDSVTSIGNYAFINCSGLTNITIPNSVTSIGKSAFYGCSSLISITIPDNVTSIDSYAFKNCSKLTDVYYSGTESDWNNISIGSDNSALTNATIHYNTEANIPTGSISSTNNVASSQTATLTLSDDAGVAGYYWGTNSNYSSNTYTTTTANSVSKTISSAGTYYLTVKDIAGNISDTVSITFYQTTLNANSGSVSPTSVLTKSGNSFTFPTPTRSGYTYQGWSTSSSATSGVKTLTPNSNATYYAVWEQKVDTTAPSITSLTSTNTVSSSQEIKMTMTDDTGIYKCYFFKDGKYKSTIIFDECAKEKTYTRAISEPGEYAFRVFDSSENSARSTTIVFYETVLDANSGSVSPTSVLTKSGNSFTFPTPTRSGYTYQGWNTSSSATSGVKSLTPNSNATYYAVWKQNETSDTTKPTGSISSTNSVAASQTATLTLSDNKSVAGYYWGTNSTYTSNAYSTSSTGSIEKAISAAGTYYLTVKDTAGNISDTVSITYYKTTLNANSGSVSPASVLTKSGNSFTFPTPTRSGYTYQGWSTSSSATSGVKSLTPSSNATYYAIWKAESVNKSFQWGKDNWAFYNSSYSGGFSSGTYRSQINNTYQKVLTNNLTNSEYQCVFKGTSYSDAWLDDTWGGSCYGMSSTTLLSKAGLLPFASYKTNASSLNQLPAPTATGLNYPASNANVSSLITYYQMLQVKDIIQQQYRSVPHNSNKENITNLIALLDKNDTVLVGFQKSGWGGHAILAYGYEYGSYSKNGVTYQGRIKICDPNHSVSNDDNYYIYFNTNSFNWTIPAYSSSGINSTKGAVFNYIGANVNEINKGGYLTSASNAVANNYIARLNAVDISDNRSITKVVNNNGIYANHSSAPGEIVEDYAFVLGGEDKGTVGYNLYDTESAYRISQEEATDLALTMEYDNCLLSSSSKAGESVIFDKNGNIELTGESADYSVGMTYDDDYPTDWFAIEVTGENANQVELEKAENGWILEADNLQNVCVNTNNKNDEAYARFSTNYDSVLIYEIDKTNIGVSVDTDNNGTYETRISTTKNISDTTVSLNQASFTYDGTAKEPTVAVKDGEKLLVLNRDYLVVYSNNTNIGTATATVVGIGAYTGTKEIQFSIVCNHQMQAKVVKPTATSIGYSEYCCTICGEYKKDSKGDIIKDSFTAPTGKLTLKHSARTANAIKVQWNNVKTATGYQVQISTKDGKKWSTYATLKAGVTAYTFKKLAAGNNYKFRVRFYIKAADGKDHFSPWSTTLNSPTLPSGTTITKLTAGIKAFTAQWKKAGFTGYQVQYSLKSNFSGAKTVTIKNAKTLKTTVKKLNAKKIYYVRIRTYKTISKVNYFSTWSNAVKVKTK